MPPIYIPPVSGGGNYTSYAPFTNTSGFLTNGVPAPVAYSSFAPFPVAHSGVTVLLALALGINFPNTFSPAFGDTFTFDFIGLDGVYALDPQVINYGLVGLSGSSTTLITNNSQLAIIPTSFATTLEYYFEDSNFNSGSPTINYVPVGPDLSLYVGWSTTGAANSFPSVTGVSYTIFAYGAFT